MSALLKATIQYSDGSSAEETFTFDDLFLKSQRDNMVAAVLQANAQIMPLEQAAQLAVLRQVRDEAAPVQYALPGDGLLLRMPDDSALSVGADGAVYLDANRLGTAMVSKLAQVGKSIYGLGKTTPIWWRWTGSTWTAVTSFDPGLLR
jgi:hypothetical protein